MATEVRDEEPAIVPERRRPGWVYRTGTEPDPRFTFANERTFLAWIRTALALIVAGVAVRAIYAGASGRTVATLLVALGVAAAVQALGRWAYSERALRRGRPLPALPALPLVAGVVAAGVTVAVAMVW
ncbi:YidH family protein [Micromonospora sp. WMMD754]|uniref:YidH family protein n=1 Tax=Micromonospora sp. WMMD754 TaxID=3404114 RepID=UPI003BF5C6AB